MKFLKQAKLPINNMHIHKEWELIKNEKETINLLKIK